jgi:tetratricopeptide (TPR) repeat protein
MAGDVGDVERASLFQLLPRLLQILPSTTTRATNPSPLISLYPALLSAAAADPKLSPLTALSPLLAHVAAAAIVDRSAAASDSAAALATALTHRAPASAAAFLRDLGDLFAATVAGARGRIAVFASFALAAAAANDVVTDVEISPGCGGRGAWPATALHIECSHVTAAALADLIVRLVRSPAWVRVGSRTRELVVRSVLSARRVSSRDGAETSEAEQAADVLFASLLRNVRDAATSGVALPRPLRMRLDSVLASMRQAAVEAAQPAISRRSAEVTPPTRKRRRVPGTPGTGTGSRLEDRLRAMGGMVWNHDACTTVSRICVAVLRDKGRVTGCFGVSALALEVGATMLSEVVGEDGKDAISVATGPDAPTALMPVLDLAASLLEISAIAQARYCNHCELESSRGGATTGGTATGTASATANQLGSTCLGTPPVSEEVTVHPSDSSAIAIVVAPVLRLLDALPEFAARHGNSSVSRVSTVVVRASMLLWRLSDLLDAFAQAHRPRSDRTLGDEVEDSLSDALAAAAPALVATAAAFQDLALEGSNVPCTRARAALLRASARTVARSLLPSDASAAEMSATRLEAVVRESLAVDSPELAVGALAALADFICACSSCRHRCFAGSDARPSSSSTSYPCSRSVWASCYRLVEPLIRGAGKNVVVGAAARVLGRLVVHAPAEKLGSAGAELVQAVWHPLSMYARIEASSCLPLIFGLANQDGDSSAGVADVDEDIRSVQRLHGREDSWDGPEATFQLGGESRGYGVVAKLLGAELQQQLASSKQASADPLPLALLGRLPVRGGGAETKVVAIAWEALLRAAVNDQQIARDVSVMNDSNVEHALAAPSFRAWSQLVFVVFAGNGTIVPSLYSSDDVLMLLDRSLLGRSAEAVGKTLQDGLHQSVSDVIARSLVARYQSWLPLSLRYLLRDDAFTARLVTVLGERSVVAFWEKVPRFALGTVLRDGNGVTLESLALRVNRPTKELVDRVCADALARAALQSADAFEESAEDKSIQLIELVMGVPITEVIETRVGKVVQRIVMEFGSGRDAVVKQALSQVGQTISYRHNVPRPLAPDELVVEHFLLVMDAVNRGLFASRVTTSERLCCLAILDAVMRLCSKSLNLFVPKVMATLKMALRVDGADRSFRDAVCRVWVTFINALGPSRLGPHLGQVVSILVPLLTYHHRIFAPAICNVFVKHREDVSPYFPSIALLMSTIAHPALAPAAEAVVADETRLTASDKDVAEFDARKYMKTLEEVLVQATTHDSAAIRSLALDHMLGKLRSKRGWLLSCIISASGDDAAKGTKKDLLRYLVHGFTGLLLHADWNVREKAIKCLGEVGAVDPVRLGESATAGFHPRRGSSASSQEKRLLPSSVRNLSIDLLKDYLVPALHRGDLPGAGNRLNRLGLAVQELLRVCGCGPDTPVAVEELADAISILVREHGDLWESGLHSERELAAHFWGRLPIDVQEAAQPYLSRPFDTSAYNMRSVVPTTEGMALPFATIAEQTLKARGRIWARLAAAAGGDGEGAQPCEWRMQMTAQLTDFVGDRGQFGSLFKALRPVLRYEDAVSTYLLPLVILDALDCSLEGEEKPGESAVFTFILGEVKDALIAGGEVAQSVFLILDTLREWRDARAAREGRLRVRKEQTRPSPGGGPRRRVPVSENELIEKACASDVLSLLVDLEGRSRLSLMLLARAAYNCRAFSRAILCAEQHILNIRRAGGLESWPAFVKEMIGGSRHSRLRENEPYLSGEDVDVGEPSFSTDVRVSETAKKVATLRDPDAEADALSLMQLCYAELEDADSMAGVAALRQETSLAETILDAEASGNFDDALLCYERALAASPRDAAMHAGFLRCLRTLGHWETMLAHADGLSHMKSAPSEGDTTLESVKVSSRALGMEAAWRLGRWERVDELCEESALTAVLGASSPSQPAMPASFGVDALSPALSFGNCGGGGHWEALYGTAVGEMLSCVRRGDARAIQRIASRARSSLLGPAANAAMEGFARAYPLIVKLHSLADIEDSIVYICDARLGRAASGTADPREPSLAERLVGMHSRSDASASSLRVREPILSCRRVCLELMDRPSEAAEVSLQLAGLARESGNLRAAASAAFRALSSATRHSDEWFAASAETARIMAAKGDKTGALLSLEKDIDRMTALLRSHDPADERIMDVQAAARHRLAVSHVLAGKWIEEARSAPAKEIVKHYQTATELAPTFGDPFYALGRFYDSLLQSPSGARGRSKYVPAVLSSFTEALRLGQGLVFEILPRLLTVCFDFFSKVEAGIRAPSGRPVESEIVKKTERGTRRAFQALPKYMWMTVLPQLMSRVLHPSEFVREHLRELLASIVVEFPDQAVWMIAPSSQLAAKERKQVASEILNRAVQLARRKTNGNTTAAQAKAKSAALKTIARNGLCVIKQLIQVCTTVLPKDRRGRAEDCSAEFAPLRRDLQGSRVIVPTLAALTVTIPDGSGGAGRRQDPFALEPVTIADMETMVLVMSSLMRPRRIGFLGSDGKYYRFLAKRETSGDMRKDSRLIDFLTVVNRLLAKDRDAQQRGLHVKTYAVLPLTEETGLIEWVNDIVPLRTLVRGEQQRISRLPDTSKVQANYEAMNKQRFHDDWGVPAHPGVLDKFFLRQFGSDPQAWLAARSLWTRSVAAWSMTGYVVGLGDRHGENLLIETTTGRCVHVDFAMLFDKGMTLKVPEIVPFRLTHNMVIAMGVAGYEGAFRVVSEIVLGVLRGNADALMGVLESFLHDPLADWAKGKARGGGGGGSAGGDDAGAGDEGNNYYAAEMRRAVELKMRGIYGRGEGELPLSIKGHVQRLIHEATSTANLSQMYIWWGAWGM